MIPDRLVAENRRLQRELALTKARCAEVEAAHQLMQDEALEVHKLLHQLCTEDGVLTRMRGSRYCVTCSDKQIRITQLEQECQMLCNTVESLKRALRRCKPQRENAFAMAAEGVSGRQAELLYGKAITEGMDDLDSAEMRALKRNDAVYHRTQSRWEPFDQLSTPKSVSRALTMWHEHDENLKQIHGSRSHEKSSLEWSEMAQDYLKGHTPGMEEHLPEVTYTQQRQLRGHASSTSSVSLATITQLHNLATSLSKSLYPGEDGPQQLQAKPTDAGQLLRLTELILHSLCCRARLPPGSSMVEPLQSTGPPRYSTGESLSEAAQRYSALFAHHVYSQSAPRPTT